MENEKISTRCGWVFFHESRPMEESLPPARDGIDRYPRGGVHARGWVVDW